MKRSHSTLLMAVILNIIACASADSGDEVTTSMVSNGSSTIEVHAQGKGPLIVMLPSSGRGAEDFDELAPLLAASGYRVVAPQPRGAGRSVGPMTGITLHDLASDIAAVIASEGNAPAFVAGHAYGNFVARMLAVDHPELVRGVVLLAAAQRVIAPEMLGYIQLCGDLTAAREVRLDALQKAFFAPGHDPSVWLDGWYPATQAAERVASAAVAQDVWWRAGTASILDLQAANDAIAPPSGGQALKAELGDRVSVVVIRDAGHALVPEQPAATAQAMVAWLRTR